MATLTDRIAKEIMGEIDEVTSKIDNIVQNVEIQFKNLPIVVKSIDDSKHNLAVLLNNLVIETKAAKAEQDKLINAHVGVGLNEIKAMTQGQIEAMNKAAQHITADEREAMFKNALQAREAAVIGTLEVIESTVAKGLKGVTAANQTFGVTGEHFRKQVDTCVVAAEKSVSDFERALQIAAKNHEPMGKFAYFMLSMLAAGIVMGTTVFFASQGYLSGTPILSSEQAQAILKEKKFEQVYSKLDVKSRAKFDALWNH